jgi:hypothetical protein
MDFFVVDHGPDNFEEWIDLDRIVFIRCSAKYNQKLKHHSDYEDLKEELAGSCASPDFDYLATIIFDNGANEKVHLNAVGWHELTEELKAKDTGCKCNNNCRKTDE